MMILLIGLASISRKRPPPDVAQLMLQHRHRQVRNLSAADRTPVGLGLMHPLNLGIAGRSPTGTVCRSESRGRSLVLNSLLAEPANDTWGPFSRCPQERF
jgi:hypothetical protein